MLWTIIVILIVLWLLGFIGHVGGSLIHLLLVIAVVVLIINLCKVGEVEESNALANCCKGGSAKRETVYRCPVKARVFLRSKQSMPSPPLGQ